MDQLTPLQVSVLVLVKQYVGRQSLVLEVMRELRPDIIVRLEKRVDSMTQEQWIELRLENQRKSQVGFWGKEQEWEYFFHGGGCRLIHKQTGERINWDAGDLNTFNLDWFISHLQWHLKQSDDNEDIKIVRSALNYTEVISDELDTQGGHQRLKMRKQILPIVAELCEKGLLTGNAQLTHFTVVNSAP